MAVKTYATDLDQYIQTKTQGNQMDEEKKNNQTENLRLQKSLETKNTSITPGTSGTTHREGFHKVIMSAEIS